MFSTQQTATDQMNQKQSTDMRGSHILRPGITSGQHLAGLADTCPFAGIKSSDLEICLWMHEKNDQKGRTLAKSCLDSTSSRFAAKPDFSKGTLPMPYRSSTMDGVPLMLFRTPPAAAPPLATLPLRACLLQVTAHSSSKLNPLLLLRGSSKSGAAPISCAPQLYSCPPPPHRLYLSRMEIS